MSNKTSNKTVNPVGPAVMKSGRWHAANGEPITGPAPLAQLGVGGTYIDAKGRTVKIMAISTDARGFTYVTGQPQ